MLIRSRPCVRTWRSMAPGSLPSNLGRVACSGFLPGKALGNKQDVEDIDFDQCELGLTMELDGTVPAPPEALYHRKRTRVKTNVPAMRRLARFRCRNQHAHTQLLGSVRKNGRWHRRTDLAKHYPTALQVELAEGWAEHWGLEPGTDPRPSATGALCRTTAEGHEGGGGATIVTPPARNQAAPDQGLLLDGAGRWWIGPLAREVQEEALHGVDATTAPADTAKAPSSWPDRTTPAFKEELIRRLRSRRSERYADFSNHDFELLETCVRHNSRAFFIDGCRPTRLRGFLFDVLLSDEEPVSSRAFPSAPDRRQDLRHHVEKQVDLGNLVRSASPYAAAGFTIREAGKDHGRFVIDYRKLNRKTIRHHSPIPDIFATLREMADSRRLTALDLDTGFHHLGLTARASERLAVVVPEGQYRWLTLPRATELSASC